MFNCEKSNTAISKFLLCRAAPAGDGERERERMGAPGVWFTPHDLGHCLWDVFSETLQSFKSAPPHSRPSAALFGEVIICFAIFFKSVWCYFSQ